MIYALFREYFVGNIITSDFNSRIATEFVADKS